MSVPFQYPRLVTPIRLTDKPVNRRIEPQSPPSGSVPEKWAISGVTAILRLARVQLDNHRFVDVASDISAIRSLLERTGQLVRVDFNPLGQALASGQIKRFTDKQLGFGLFTDGDHIACLEDRKSVVLGKRESVRVDLGGGGIFKNK